MFEASFTELIGLMFPTTEPWKCAITHTVGFILSQELQAQSWHFFQCFFRKKTWIQNKDGFYINLKFGSDNKCILQWVTNKIQGVFFAHNFDQSSVHLECCCWFWKGCKGLWLKKLLWGFYWNPIEGGNFYLRHSCALTVRKHDLKSTWIQWG